MAANKSTKNDGKSPHLMAVPVELLQRVANNLSDETLPTFRLTCKAIETATFDQFADTFFKTRYCYIHDEPRWTLLRDVLSSMMADRIRRVVFTNKVLAPASAGQLQIVPEKRSYYTTSDQSMDFSEVQLAFAQAQLGVEEAMAGSWDPTAMLFTQPSKDTIDRLLVDIKTLTPDVLVELDFGANFEGERFEDRTLPRADVLAALAASRLELTAFATTLVDVNNPETTMSSHDMDPSSLRSFSYSECDPYEDCPAPLKTKTGRWPAISSASFWNQSLGCAT